MNEKMSRNVRDADDLVPESAFNTTPVMAALRARLEEAKKSWHAARDEFDRVRFRLEGLPAEVQGLKDQADAIDAERPTGVGRVVVAGGDDFAEDDALLARKAALLLKADRLVLGRLVLEQAYRSLQRAVETSAQPVLEIEQQISTTRHKLRFAEAKRRAA